MNAQPAPSPAVRKKRRLTRLLVCGIVLVTLFLVYHLTLSLMIQRRLAAIRRAGFPATCAELDKWYVRPAVSENAASVFDAAFASFHPWTNDLPQSSVQTNFVSAGPCDRPPKTRGDLLPVVGMTTLPPKGQPLPAEMERLIAEYLADNAEALRLLHQAAAMKSCRYKVNFTEQSSAVNWGPVSSVRQAIRLLYLETILDVDRQDNEQAVASVIASLGVSRSLSQEPTLISYLCGTACQDIGLDSLDRTFNRVLLTENQLTILADAVGKLDDTNCLTRAFVGERCLHDDLFQKLRRGNYVIDELGELDDKTFWVAPLWRVYNAAGLFKLDELAVLDITQGFIDATQLPFPQSFLAAPAVSNLLSNLVFWHIPSRMMYLDYSSTFRIAARSVANIRDARTAIAIERYRLANGKLPDKLSDLVPTVLSAVPVDPFDGKPLRYKVLAKGYVVYSVGEDRVDNNGAEKNNGGIRYVPGTDITFTVER